MWSAHGPYVVTFAPLCGHFCATMWSLLRHYVKRLALFAHMSRMCAPHVRDVRATCPGCALHIRFLHLKLGKYVRTTSGRCARHMFRMCAPHVQDVRFTYLFHMCAPHAPHVRPTCTRCALHMRRRFALIK